MCCQRLQNLLLTYSEYLLSSLLTQRFILSNLPALYLGKFYHFMLHMKHMPITLNLYVSARLPKIVLQDETVYCSKSCEDWADTILRVAPISLKNRIGHNDTMMTKVVIGLILSPDSVRPIIVWIRPATRYIFSKSEIRRKPIQLAY